MSEGNGKDPLGDWLKANPPSEEQQEAAKKLVATEKNRQDREKMEKAENEADVIYLEVGKGAGVSIMDNGMSVHARMHHMGKGEGMRKILVLRAFKTPIKDS